MLLPQDSSGDQVMHMLCDDRDAGDVYGKSDQLCWLYLIFESLYETDNDKIQ